MAYLLQSILFYPLSRYISRSDDSPLMPALVGWRRRTLSMVSSPNHITVEGPRTPIVAPRPSSWLLWWSRNRTTSDVKKSLLEKPLTSLGTGYASAPPGRVGGTLY